MCNESSFPTYDVCTFCTSNILIETSYRRGWLVFFQGRQVEGLRMFFDPWRHHVYVRAWSRPRVVTFSFINLAMKRHVTHGYDCTTFDRSGRHIVLSELYMFYVILLCTCYLYMHTNRGFSGPHLPEMYMYSFYSLWFFCSLDVVCHQVCRPLLTR